MKLLFYNHTSIVSGAERVLLLILSQLNARAFQSVVMCPTGDLQRLVEENHVPCLPVELLQARFTWRPDYLLRYLLSFVRVMLNVRAQVKTIAPDLIHANSIRAGLVMIAATIGLRVPVIWHLHDLLPHHPISTAIRACVLFSSRVRLLAVSQATIERFHGRLLRVFPKRIPSCVLLNCADTEKFRPDSKSRSAVRTELALRANQLVVGIIGQITERKGQLGLLRAFAQVLRQIPDAVLLIVGEPLFTAADEQYFRGLQQTAAALGIAPQVRFLGARRDVPTLMQALDLLVVNSLAEPCGLVVLEGMASALPVLATAVGGNPEMIQHGASGWLVPAQDDTALAEAIVKLDQTPALCQALGANARARICEHFTIRGYRAALETFYSECGQKTASKEKDWTELEAQSSVLHSND